MTDQLVVGGQLGSYLIESVIGRGGMSVVFRAKHERLGMPVALKVLAPELSKDDTFRERFLREAQIAAGIGHPNVIPVHDMGLHEDSLYIVMRYVAGGDLKTLLTEAGPLELDQAIALLTPIALALDTAHAHGLVHRDVKPANILIQRSTAGEIEHVYLTDFGIAKSASFTGALTGAGASIGTVGYMAPEQLEGSEVTAQTDVYALAVTFYECLTCRVPFQRELAEGAWPPTGALEPIARARPDVPPAFDDVMLKALSRDPAARYETCEQFARACRKASLADSPELTDRADEALAATSLSAPEAPAISPPEPAAPAQQASAETPDGPPAPPEAVESAPPSGPLPSSPLASPPPGGRSRSLGVAAALFAGVAVGVVAVVLLSRGSSTPAGRLSASALGDVPTNHVTGSGEATIRLNGDVATVTVTTVGLDNGEELVHLMHIHAGGKGECPPASAARLHNGHLAISTTDGINYYGSPVQALTTHGDTSVASILVFSRFPSGGALHYSRTITLPPSVATEIRRDNAVVVIHGTDYDGTGIYSGVLDRSDLNKAVPGTATAPALCGRLTGVQSAAAHGWRSSDRTISYTASLRPSGATQIVTTQGVFLCHAGEGGAPVGEGRRTPAPADSKATA